MATIRQLTKRLGLLLLLFITACGSPAQPEASAPAVPTPTQVSAATFTAAPAATAPPMTESTVTPTSLPPTVEQPTAPPEVTDWLMVEGKTEDGYTYRGNPDASVTILDYSDFL